MKTLFICFLSFFLAFAINAAEEQAPAPLLVWDGINHTDGLPINFRSTNSSLPTISLENPSPEGLKALHISGSSQFSKQELLKIIETVGTANGKLYIIDLRNESHGFLNDLPVSWYGVKNWANASLSSKAIERQEELLLANLAKEKEVQVYTILKKNDNGQIENTSAEKVVVSKVYSERELANQLALPYLRFYVKDETFPSHEEIDAFIQFVKDLPEKHWLHFHCRAGKGRTTTMMAVYDILQNAKKVSLEDIITRQYLLGGVNLAEVDRGQNYKTENFKARLAFIKNFYEYAKTNDDDYDTLWSDYLKGELVSLREIRAKN